MSEKNAKLFNEMEIDAIGEILNISLGSSATAVSDMLERRVDITTPKVRVLDIDEFEFTSLEPAIAVEITYVEGLSGNNIMLLKRTDVKNILELLMHTEISDEEFELDELSMSAVCEVMNQMMGASATALAEFLGEVINISTPVSFEVEESMDFKKKYFEPEQPMVVVSFKLDIEGCLHSEFMTLMEVQLAKHLVSSFGLSDVDENGEVNLIQPVGMQMSKEADSNEDIPQNGARTMSQQEIEEMMAQMTGASDSVAPEPSSSKTMSQEEIERMMEGMSATPNTDSMAQPMQQQPMMQQQP
ncbi:MAG: chemotaxis protein CheC, partial [Anaerovorax sp.]|nr:chemotaxis protein CheC [Anaerovorax sp.]